MSGTLIQSEFVYRSGVSPQIYQFTIVSDTTGIIKVRDIQDPWGFVISPYSTIPQSVTNDISSAMGQVENLLSLTSTINGTVTFANETSKSVSFVTPLADTSYRVVISAGVFAPFRIVNKTTAGFVLEAGATISGSVGYDVLL